MNTDKKILITGAAGFIGYHTAKRFLKENFHVIGLDNLNAYYEINLKKSRLKDLEAIAKKNKSNWEFIEGDLENNVLINNLFAKFNPQIVINLAAQAGVRYSIENPRTYIKSNIIGFSNILEACRNFKTKNLLYASSSSVYGGNKKLPFNEKDSVDHPVSLYAATKKSNEIMAHSYSHLYNIPATGLRFFTVYGPWGRPDMAPMIFANAIKNQETLEIFNYGKMKRDFTYIDDIVEAIYRCSFKPANPDSEFNKLDPNPSTSNAPHRIFNLGNSKPIKLLEFIETLENSLKIKAKKEFLPMQQGDVKETVADTEALRKWINFKPNTSLKDGIDKFTKWYLDYYQ